MTTDVAKRFNELPWHDSKLLELSIYRSAGEELVHMLVAFVQRNGAYLLSDVVLAQSIYIDARIDLVAKQECADDIASGHCCSSSPWFDEFKGAHPVESGSDYLHFRIDLIPFGGLIDVVARNFSIKPGDELTYAQLIEMQTAGRKI